MDVEAKLKQKRGCMKGQREREREERGDKHKQGEGREIASFFLDGEAMK